MGISYVLGGIFTIVGLGFLVWGILASPTALTDDGNMRLKTFLYIMGGGFGAMGIGIVALGRWLRRGNQVRGAFFDQHGIAGQAKIVGLQDTGWVINGSPRVELALEVSIPGRSTYSVRRTEVVPQIFVGLLTAGRPLAVRVDPTDPDNLVIDWSRSLAV